MLKISPESQPLTPCRTERWNFLFTACSETGKFAEIRGLVICNAAGNRGSSDKVHNSTIHFKSMAEFTSEQEEELRESLKRCSDETVEAAVKFRKTGDAALVPTIVLGIIERFLDEDVVPKLQSGDPAIKVQEDLGVDSLTMVEVVMLVEEAVDITIDNNELRELVTVGDINSFIARKVSSPS